MYTRRQTVHYHSTHLSLWASHRHFFLIFLLCRSRSKSPPRERKRYDRDGSRERGDKRPDDSGRRRERSRDPEPRKAAAEKGDGGDKGKKKDDEMLTTKTGGAYIPPARLRYVCTIYKFFIRIRVVQKFKKNIGPVIQIWIFWTLRTPPCVKICENLLFDFW
jgi:hypothetical protein